MRLHAAIHGWVMAALMAIFVTVPVCAMEPWEKAAVDGIQLMNQGDGKAFSAAAHKDLKLMMRKVVTEGTRQSQEKGDTKEFLNAFGVSSFEELEKIPLDQFMEYLIRGMHKGGNPELRDALKSAQFKVIGSKVEGALARVSLEMTTVLSGKQKTLPLNLIAKQEDGVWKYYGEQGMMGDTKK